LLAEPVVVAAAPLLVRDERKPSEAPGGDSRDMGAGEGLLREEIAESKK
jgi:hypothetical protein